MNDVIIGTCLSCWYKGYDECEHVYIPALLPDDRCQDCEEGNEHETTLVCDTKSEE